MQVVLREAGVSPIPVSAEPCKQKQKQNKRKKKYFSQNFCHYNCYAQYYFSMVAKVLTNTEAEF